MYVHMCTLTFALYAISFACFIGIALSLPRLMGSISIDWSRIARDFRDNFGFGKWLFGGNMALLASTQIPAWSLAVLDGTATTGVFAASDGVTSLMRTFLAGCQNFIGPECARLSECKASSELFSFNKRMSTLLLGVTSAFFVVLMLFRQSHCATDLWRGILAAGSLPMLLSLNLVVSSVTLTCGYALSAMNRPDLNLKANVFALGLQLA